MRRVLVLVALVSGLAGCAGTAGQRPSGPESPSSVAPGPSASAAPSSGPAGGPAPDPSGMTTTIASDEFPAGVVVGTVTVDSGGPCYLIETDDGQQYALIGRAGTVYRGQRVRALTEPRPSAVDCGPGVPLTLVKLEVS